MVKIGYLQKIKIIHTRSMRTSYNSSLDFLRVGTSSHTSSLNTVQDIPLPGSQHRLWSVRLLLLLNAEAFVSKGNPRERPICRYYCTALPDFFPPCSPDHERDWPQ